MSCFLTRINVSVRLDPYFRAVWPLFGGYLSASDSLGLKQPKVETSEIVRQFGQKSVIFAVI